MKIERIDQIQIGDTIRVDEKPIMGSTYNGAKVCSKFPVVFTIEDKQVIEHVSHWINHTFIKGGGYGWNAELMIEAGCTLISRVKNENTINIKEMKEKILIETRALKTAKGKRYITLYLTVLEDGEVRTGYAVRMPIDKNVKGLSEKIAHGRAMNNRTNLTPDMYLGESLNRKYFREAIVDYIFKGVEMGVTNIKGIGQLARNKK